MRKGNLVISMTIEDVVQLKQGTQTSLERMIFSREQSLNGLLILQLQLGISHHCTPGQRSAYSHHIETEKIEAL